MNLTSKFLCPFNSVRYDFFVLEASCLRIVVSARAIALASRFEKSDQIELTIQNSGCEIPEPALSHIFEKFYRVPSHAPWKQGGTGLGLALVEKLVALLNGEIKVESRVNQVIFRVTLPGQELGEMN
ncbi:ATP-binding protein [Trichocoleus sp. FACHB-262]|uniref:ATP-binding protein n=1 Tax=Trichocoleus sp. FACHB-262 TaxID=2692869 RepID=UPI00168A0303|nr:ATP-binding protein [Trichocoleus sp. FACHB-262]MBD2122571.1 sensor histidine kinase [Trichocoleus sp. FACHB-262]